MIALLKQRGELEKGGDGVFMIGKSMVNSPLPQLKNFSILGKMTNGKQVVHM